MTVTTTNSGHFHVSSGTIAEVLAVLASNVFDPAKVLWYTDDLTDAKALWYK